jgi:hypothetical protein
MGKAKDKICLLFTFTLRSSNEADVSIFLQIYSYFAIQLITLKTIYTYHTKEDASSAPKKLIIEIGDDGISLFSFNLDEKKPIAINLLEFEKDKDLQTNFLACTDSILNEAKHANQISIYYNVKDSVLVPHKYHQSSNNADYLNLMFAQDQDVIILEDQVSHLNAVNVYQIPEQIHQWFKLQFSEAIFSHSTSKQILSSTNASDLKVIFAFGTMKVLFFTGGNLQLIQYFKHQTPEDALYHLLSICEVHQINPAEINLQIMGMIEKSSAIFQLLYNYFLTINLSQENHFFSFYENDEAAPIHYFSHLFEMTT